MANDGIVTESAVDLRVQIREDYGAITEPNDSYGDDIAPAVLNHSCGTELRRIEAEIRGELELGFVTANGSDVRSALVG